MNTQAHQTLPIDPQRRSRLAATTCYAAIDVARNKKIKECLLSLAAWATKRAAGEHNATTTISMLHTRAKIIQYQVDNAGLRAENLKPRKRHNIKAEPPPVSGGEAQRKTLE